MGKIKVAGAAAAGNPASMSGGDDGKNKTDQERERILTGLRQITTFPVVEKLLREANQRYRALRHP
ncbi:hypothetical protein [uncultured Desulfosarcina sp.]|uniref:hypothetical protein n=1 Tax=uncultured Desulfosarcina sp. TaxID=218289 RepID=UPI0029C7D509|nr:hypothetical protein [uncultured Desulfosarcina sp.]